MIRTTKVLILLSPHTRLRELGTLMNHATAIPTAMTTQTRLILRRPHRPPHPLLTNRVILTLAPPPRQAVDIRHSQLTRMIHRAHFPFAMTASLPRPVSLAQHLDPPTDVVE
jgi:hypothetical protein